MDFQQDADAIEKLNETGDLRQILRRYKVIIIIISLAFCLLPFVMIYFWQCFFFLNWSALDRKPSAIRAAATATCRVPSVPAPRNPSTATTSPPNFKLSSASPATKRVLSVASLVHPLRLPLDQTSIHHTTSPSFLLYIPADSAMNMN